MRAGGIGRRLRAGALGLLAAAALVAVPALVRAAEAPGTERAMKIVYLTGGSVYVDAGSSDGLGLGDTLVVRRLGSEIALLRVSDLSTHRAACDTLLSRNPLEVGDRVRLIGRAPRPAEDEAPVAAEGAPAPGAATDSSVIEGGAARAAAAPIAPKSRPWWRGRAGARWTSVTSEGGVRFEQPMLDLRLEGGSEASAVAAGLDVRGRRTVRTSAAGATDDDAEARVYRAALAWQRPGVPARLSAGRLTSPSLASVSTFDGGLLEAVGGRWKLGAFGGTQPDPAHMRWSSRVREYGAYLEAHQKDFPTRRWQAGIGAVSSYDGRHSSRDFLFAQGFYRDARLSGSWLQEADVLRPSKRRAGDAGFSPTSTFLTGRAQVVPAFALVTGYDNRRNVRLWRDRVTPATEFDDRYRQGVWAGAVVNALGAVTLTGDRRWNRAGGEATTVSSAGLDLRARRWRAATLGGRWSRFDSATSESRLLAGSLGLDPTATSHLEMSAGRRESAVSGGDPDPSVGWWGVSGDLMLGRRWFLDASYEASRGTAERGAQFYAGLSRRL